jgi:hypothetical protein
MPEAKTPDAQPPLFISGLRNVLIALRNIDVVGFDACLMAMIEIAYELRNTATFMVASQSVLPAARNWPYQAFLREVTTFPAMEPEEFVQTLLSTFAGSYNAATEAVTMSILRLSSEVERTVKAIDSFAGVLIEAAEDKDLKDAIGFARRYTQSFGNADYIDLVSFCDQVKKRLPDVQSLNRAADQVKEAVSRLVFRHFQSGAASVANANGISIYYPTSQFVESYEQLTFANSQICRWSNFIKLMVSSKAVPQKEELSPAATAPKSMPKVAAGCQCEGCGSTLDESDEVAMHSA